MTLSFEVIILKKHRYWNTKFHFSFRFRRISIDWFLDYFDIEIWIINDHINKLDHSSLPYFERGIVAIF